MYHCAEDMPSPNPRLRAMVPLTLQPQELKEADRPTLVATLRDKSKLLSFRSVAAMRLGECADNPEAAQALADALNTGHENLNLRGIAAISLGQLGGPVAAEALKRVVLNRADAKYEASNGRGGKLSFQGLAAMALSDSPAGRDALRQILRYPRGYGMAWALALLSLHGDDYSTLIDVASAMAADLRQPVELRDAAIEVLGEELNSGDASGWDGLVSIAMAKSEPERLRNRAREVLKKRRK